MWRDVEAGSEIELFDGLKGIVMVNFENGTSTTDFPLDQWLDTQGGLLVLSSDIGLVRYTRSTLELRQKA
jgi:hypothetical protein